MAFDLPNPFAGEKQAGSAVSGAVSGEGQEKKGPTVS